mgnify:CR=1 FL=1
MLVLIRSETHCRRSTDATADQDARARKPLARLTELTGGAQVFFDMKFQGSAAYAVDGNRVALYRVQARP